MSTTHKDWIEYWKQIAPPLEAHIQSQRVPDAESYIKCCFAFFSFVTEDFVKKITKNNSLFTGISPLIVELQDILRGTFHTQVNLIIATSAFNLRSAFEIRSNLTYIYKHNNPSEMIQRLSYFFRYEQIVGSRLSPNLSYEGEEIEKAFADVHTYWKNKTTGLLKDNADWNGEDKKFKTICDDLKWQDDYFYVYKLTSKFNHGSPIVRNMYQTHRGLSCMADPKNTTIFNILCAHHICEWLMDTCEFFGVDFPELEYRKIQMKVLELKKIIDF